MPNPDFIPLSHEELRELWILGRDMPQSFTVRRLILSAVWWESQKIGKLVVGSTYPLKTAQERFLAKLREVGIDWREDG
mgnify:CR=1 FL=1